MLTVNVYALPAFLSALFVGGMGLWVFLKKPESSSHRAFLYFCFSIFIWLGCYAGIYCSTNAETAFVWSRLAFLGVGFIPFTNFYFYITMEKMKGKRGITSAFLVLSIIFIFLSQTTLTIYKGVESFFWGYYSQAGPIHVVFLIFWSTVWTYGLYLVYHRMQEQKRSGDAVSYNQSKYVFLAYLGECLGFVDFLPKYGIPFYPFGYFCALYWSSLIAFVIMRHNKLADISSLSRRVFIYSVFFLAMLVISGQCYLLVRTIQSHFDGLNNTIVLVTVSLVMGLIFQPLYRKVKYLVDRTFFPEHVEKKEKLAQITQEIMVSKSPVEFNRIILESVHSFFKSIKASLFLWNEAEQSYLMQSATGWGIQLNKDMTTRLPGNHCIPNFLSENEYLLFDSIRQDFSPDLDQKTLTATLLEIEASICVPIKKDGKLLGILILGDKESGLPYGSEDLKTLKALTDQSAVALENLNLFKRWNEGVTQTHQMSKILHRYMSPSVADEVLKRVDDLHSWKGDKRYVAVLMADLREFTRISDNYDPEEVVRWLNEYFSEMIETILSNGGTVDKFMGDAVLAVFGAPTPLPNVEFRAVNCAVEMHNCIKKLNQKRAEQGLFPLQMGIAVTAGDVVAGNIGSDKRMEYTVIGDAVNLVSRLQGLANNGQVLTSANVAEKILDKVEAKRLDPVYVKGKTNPLDIYEITSIKPQPQRAMEIESESNLDLPNDDNRLSQAQ